MSNELQDLMIKAVAKKIPQSLGRGLKKIAAKNDDPLTGAIVGILSDTLERHGASTVEVIGEHLVDLVEGTDPMASYKLNQQGVELSDLVDALQNADADRREKASKFIQMVSVLLTDIGSVLVETAVTALKNR